MTEPDNDSAALTILGINLQHRRLLRLRFPRGDGPEHVVLVANALDAVEGLSRDFVFTVELLSDSAIIDLDSVLGKMVTVELIKDDGTLRFFNGYVFEFSLVKTDGGSAYYSMVLRPWLAYLHLRSNSVAFHKLTVVELTDIVLGYYGKRDWTHRIGGANPAVTYICQHNESDHNLLHRYWEGAGWSYFYEHRADGHALRLSDDTRVSGAAIDGDLGNIAYQDKAGALEADGIHRWGEARSLRPDSMTLASFNFKHPRPKRVEVTLSQSKGAAPRLEVYENTGTYGFADFEGGEALAQLRLEESEARRLEFKAEGNSRCVQPGRWFTLSGYAGAEGGGQEQRKYLITGVHHRASNNYQNRAKALSSYVNTIRSIPLAAPWRPGRGLSSMEPKIYGVQTAIVVGPKGEEIHTDGYGRVKVQFHWDRLGQFDEQSSPWVRVVTGWAGSQFGQISLPRIGMEVVVQFLDGRIDHPLIVGTVYNASNMPPWELPANKTQSGILSRSTTGATAANANAFRFEDKQGAEEVWLHAEKDQRFEVEHDESHWVGQDRGKRIDRDETVEVGRDRCETVMQNETITVKNNRSERVDHDETIDIGDNRTERVGGNEKIAISGFKSERVKLAKEESIGLGKALTVGAAYQVAVAGAMNTTVGVSQSSQVANDKHTSVGGGYAIEAADAFTIRVGAASFSMSSDGTITLKGANILIEGSAPVVINGKSVDLNSGAKGGAPASKQTAAAGGAVAGAASSDAAPGAQATAAPIIRTVDPEHTYSKEEQATINKSLDDSRAMLLKQSAALKRWNQGDKDEFYNAFGTDSEAARQAIMQRTDHLLEMNESMTAADFSPADRNYRGTALDDEEFNSLAGYVNPNARSRTVYLGPAYWAAPDVGLDSRASTIVHELSHFDTVAGCEVGAGASFCRTIDGYLDPATGKEMTDAVSGSRVSVYGVQASGRLTSEQALLHANSFETISPG